MAATSSVASIRVIPIPMFDDNYSYLLIDENNVCAVVDPAEPKKALAAAEAQGVTISVVLTTHKHWDHSGGNEEIASAIPGLTVVGGALDMVPACTMPVEDGQSFNVGNISITCLLTPGHTKGHITYYCVSGDCKHVFTGDVMFIGGCGKFFEGTAAEMYPSLYEKIAELPNETVVWPGHEYTVSNFKFASLVEPTNETITAKAAWAEEQRSQGAFTIPSTIGDEKQHNVFLRCSCMTVRGACNLDEGASLVDCLGKLRSMKDQGWKGNP